MELKHFTEKDELIFYTPLDKYSTPTRANTLYVIELYDCKTRTIAFVKDKKYITPLGDFDDIQILILGVVREIASRSIVKSVFEIEKPKTPLLDFAVCHNFADRI